MNQILMTEDRNKAKKSKVKTPREPGDITGVVRFFAVLILLFGLVLSAGGTYAFTKNIELSKTTKAPVVSVLKTGNTAKVTVECETGIRNVSFSWNESTPTIVQGRGNKTLDDLSIFTEEDLKKINENITRHENKSIFLYGLYLVADN